MATSGAVWRILASELEKEGIENKGIFDEFVLDDWLHIESMSDNEWWLRIGDARIWVTVGDTGTRVDISRGCYDEINGDTFTENSVPNSATPP